MHPFGGSEVNRRDHGREDVAGGLSRFANRRLSERRWDCVQGVAALLKGQGPGGAKAPLPMGYVFVVRCLLGVKAKK